MQMERFNLGKRRRHFPPGDDSMLLLWIPPIAGFMSLADASPSHPVPVGGPKTNPVLNDAWYIAQDFLDPNGGTAADNYRHLAEDLSRTGGSDIDVGETVKSIGDGVLIGVGYVYNSGQHFGHVVLIKHPLPGGSYVVSLYAHLGTAGLIPASRLGTKVAMGEPIGLIGANSPTENGGFLPHVHLEIRTPKAVGDSVNLFTPISSRRASMACEDRKSTPSRSARCFSRCQSARRSTRPMSVFVAMANAIVVGVRSRK
jgi:murein DD-endopeptidase MepM/ murein hydrolase activator NlpD